MTRSVYDIVQTTYDVDVLIFIDIACVPREIISFVLLEITTHKFIFVIVNSLRKSGRQRKLNTNIS